MENTKEKTLTASEVWDFIFKYFNLNTAINKRSILKNFVRLHYYSGAEYFLQNMISIIRKDFEVSSIQDIVDFKEEEFKAIKTRYKRLSSLANHVKDKKQNLKLATSIIKSSLTEVLKGNSYVEFNNELTTFLLSYGYTFDKNTTELVRVNQVYTSDLMVHLKALSKDYNDPRVSKSYEIALEAVECISTHRGLSAIKKIKEMNFKVLQFCCAKNSQVFDFLDYKEMLGFLSLKSKRSLNKKLCSQEFINIFDNLFVILNKENSLSQAEAKIYAQQLDSCVEAKVLFELSMSLILHILTETINNRL